MDDMPGRIFPRLKEPEGMESSPETADRVFITFPENAIASKSDHLVRLDPAGDSPDGHSSGQCFLKKPGGQTKINRLEVRAALDMSVNVLPFWLCTFPVSCYAMALYWCVQLDGDCDAVFLTWTYTWDVFLLHSIYNPLMYMSTSTEFRRALSHIARKLINVFRIEVYEN